MKADADAIAYRILVRLTAHGAMLIREKGRWRLSAPGGDRNGREVDPQLASTLLRRGLLAVENDGALRITASGSALVRRRLAGAEDFARQHQDRAEIAVDDAELGRRHVTINHDESPLSWLRRRKDRNGRPMLDAAEFEAGERLRSDYERAHLMPRVTANWNAAVPAGKRSGGGNSTAELTEVALAARRRVEVALGALDPELANIAVDFCCFLKGLEEIERERQWPTRSAKVVLRLALAALARQYGLVTQATGPRTLRSRHWGAEGYRPTIDEQQVR